MPELPDEDNDEEAQRLLADMAAEDETDDGSEDDGPSEEEKTKLADAGKQAIDRMKAKWQKERDDRKRIEAELAALKAPKADDEKPDVEELRKQAREEARVEALKERALDKLEAKAARLLANPEDARAFLASKVEDFIDGQTVDVDAINDALADLLKERPYLAVTQGDEKRFKDIDAGVHERPAGKPQLTKTDVENLAREGKYGEIEDARQDGRLNKLLGIT